METVLKLAMTSTSMSRDPALEISVGRICKLHLEYENGRDLLTLVFHDVEAFRCTYFFAVDPWLVNAAYNEIVDLGNTTWLKEVIVNIENAKGDSSGLSHLAIYFDEGPAYEFLCRNISLLPEGVP